MTGANDFWLNLVRLEESYRDGGSTPADRAASAMRLFEEMTTKARGEMLATLRAVTYQMEDLYAIAGARAKSLAQRVPAAS